MAFAPDPPAEQGLPSREPGRKAKESSTLVPNADLVDAWLVEYHETGNRSLRNAILESFLPLADMYARRLQRLNAPAEDLRQVALLAVVRAMDRFDPAFGVRFATYAGRTIEGELKRYHRDRTWSIRPPRRMQELYLEVKGAEERLAQELGRPPTVHELAKYVGESVEHVLEALETSNAYRSRSLDEPREDDEGEARSSGGPAEMESGYDRAEVRIVLRDLLETLPERERAVIRLAFFEEWSQQAIANELGISQSYLSRTLRRTLAELRHRLEHAGDLCA